MTATNESTRWTIPQWIFLVVFVFAVQGMLVFFVSDWALPPPQKFSDSGVYSIDTQQWRASNRFLARDPSLFSRIHRRSFSGRLWEETLAPDHKYEAWTETPQYYEGKQSVDGAAFRRRQGGETAISPSVVSKPAPVLSESEQPQKTTETAPFIRILGDVQVRLPDDYPALPSPSWPEKTLPHPTVIEAGVDRLGRVQTAVILSNSLPAKHLPAGHLPGPDAEALNWVRQLRFQPAPASSQPADTGFAWGKIIFHWSVNAPQDGLSAESSP